jgi:beta-glucuronidase
MRLLLLSVALCQISSAQSLSGLWDFRWDPDSKGEKSGWQNSTAADGWTKIQVPGSFDQTFRDSISYQGKAWYRTTFRAAPGRSFLRFDGVAIRSKVWVNGTLVGEHLFPYTGFEFEVTKAVHAGAPNLLVVMADNEILEKAIPDTHWWGWWNYGGINRDVRLEPYREKVALTTRLRSDGSWDVEIGGAGPRPAQLQIDDPQGRRVWQSTTSLVANIKDGKAWSPASPSLYTLRVNGSSIRFGLRQVEVRGTQIYLNGKPIVLKGVNRQEMYPGSGMTLSREQQRKDMEDIKALGCNFVRLAHYSQSPQVYDLCDELGLLVWSEIPAWQTKPEVLGDPEVWRTYGEPQLREMIVEHRNHPSVIIWSVGNEFASDKPPVATYVKEAADFVRQLDPTRLVTFASDRRDRDICFDFVDLIAINEYYGWYYGSIEDFGPNLDKIHQKWPNKPILVSEFGAEGIPGWRNPNPPETGMDYSEDHQIKLLTTHLAEIFAPNRRSFMAGSTIWVYNDFPDPHRFGKLHPPIASYINCKGLVTQDRQKKRAYYEVQKIYRKE